MCGKTPDLLWLEERGNEVVGVELSEMAVVAFFEENDIEYEEVDGQLRQYRALDRSVSLYCGDYFEFGEGSFDAHYDRGAFVAMPPNLRPHYAKHTTSLLTKDAAQLVITVEYDQGVCDGPPYSIDPAEATTCWPRLRRHACVDDTENAPPKFLAAGLDKMHEVVWLADKDGTRG